MIGGRRKTGRRRHLSTVQPSPAQLKGREWDDCCGGYMYCRTFTLRRRPQVGGTSKNSSGVSPSDIGCSTLFPPRCGKEGDIKERCQSTKATCTVDAATKTSSCEACDVTGNEDSC